MPVIRILLLSLSMFTLSACGVIDYFYLPPSEDTVQELYESGTDYMRNKEYYKASVSFAKIKDNYPYSPYAIKAELALGDSLYLNKRYQEAAEAYLDFESLHPRDEAIPYVLFQIGMSLENTFISVDRPVTELKDAIGYFERLMQVYPDTEYAEQAPEQILLCRRKLAERELYVAEIFWNMNNYGAAWKRYGYVYDNYNDIEDLANFAANKAQASFAKYKQTASKEAKQEIEGSWKDYFKWL